MTSQPSPTSLRLEPSARVPLQRFVMIVFYVLLSLATAASAAPKAPQPSPNASPSNPSRDVELSPTVSKLLDDAATPPDQRRALALFHGQWDKIDQPTVFEQAAIALQRYDLTNPVLNDPAISPIISAKAALRRGQPHEALSQLEASLRQEPSQDGEDSMLQAAVLAAQAQEWQGAIRQAVAVLEPWQDRLRLEPPDDAPGLTAFGDALVLLAKLQGRPAADYKRAMSLYGKAHQERDRLYWPALLAEAQLLIAKDNIPRPRQHWSKPCDSTLVVVKPGTVWVR